MSRENGTWYMVQLNPVPVFGAKKKKNSIIWRNFFTEISVQMVSAAGNLLDKTEFIRTAWYLWERQLSKIRVQKLIKFSSQIYNLMLKNTKKLLKM